MMPSGDQHAVEEAVAAEKAADRVDLDDVAHQQRDRRRRASAVYFSRPVEAREQAARPDSRARRVMSATPSESRQVWKKTGMKVASEKKRT